MLSSLSKVLEESLDKTNTALGSSAKVNNVEFASAIGTSSSHPQIGSSTQPVYVNSNGKLTACTSYSNATVRYINGSDEYYSGTTNSSGSWEPSDDYISLSNGIYFIELYINYTYVSSVLIPHGSSRDGRSAYSCLMSNGNSGGSYYYVHVWSALSDWSNNGGIQIFYNGTAVANKSFNFTLYRIK